MGDFTNVLDLTGKKWMGRLMIQTAIYFYRLHLDRPGQRLAGLCKLETSWPEILQSNAAMLPVLTC